MSSSKWSFSRARTYHTCPKAYKLLYLDNVEKRNNAFAEWGSLIHKCMEEYHKGNLDLFNLVDYYIEHYDEYMVDRFPYNRYVDMGESYYEKGIEYLSNFTGFGDKYEVIGVEQEINITINGYQVIGYIDLILKDKNDGSYVILDHKSSSTLKGKELEMYLNQIYLYSIYVKDQYGDYPQKLMFNLFKTGKIVEFDFDKGRLDEAIDWFVGTVSRAENDEQYQDAIEMLGIDLAEFRRNDWYCNNLCSARNHCDKSICSESGDIDWL